MSCRVEVVVLSSSFLHRDDCAADGCGNKRQQQGSNEDSSPGETTPATRNRLGFPDVPRARNQFCFIFSNGLPAGRTDLGGGCFLIHQSIFAQNVNLTGNSERASRAMSCRVKVVVLCLSCLRPNPVPKDGESHGREEHPRNCVITDQIRRGPATVDDTTTPAPVTTKEQSNVMHGVFEPYKREPECDSSDAQKEQIAPRRHSTSEQVMPGDEDADEHSHKGKMGRPERGSLVTGNGATRDLADNGGKDDQDAGRCDDEKDHS